MDMTASEDLDSEFLAEVAEILEDRDFRKLSGYTQHRSTTRMMHSMNVAYISWRIARKFGCDEKAAARAGLLHDFFLYNFKEEKDTNEWQAFRHPKVAAKNSQEHFDISKKEKEAILSHMFPLGPMPSSREAWIITCADKMCACVELCHIDIALARRFRVMVNPA